MWKKLLKIMVIVAVMMAAYPGAFYLYWLWRAISEDPMILIREEEGMKLLSTEELMRKMHSVDPFSPYPSMAISILGERKAEEAVPALIKKLSSRDRGTRQTAITALGEIGDRKAIPDLMKIVTTRSENDYEYRLVLESLAKMKSEEAYPYVVYLAKKKNPISIALLREYADPKTISMIEDMGAKFSGNDILDEVYRPRIDEAIAHIKKVNNIGD
ncbi:MAG: HEAT repeat domain-containing protein [Candidatus Omnitrophica bacterium]|nr:HEAT repeat domain-containing protein [Candidatus Omnitrophota bacterium]